MKILKVTNRRGFSRVKTLFLRIKGVTCKVHAVRPPQTQLDLFKRLRNLPLVPAFSQDPSGFAPSSP